MPVLAALPIVPGTSVGTVLSMRLLEPVDLRLLTMHALGMTRTELITRADQPVDAAQAARLSDLLRRRLAGEPVAYLLGQREFYGLMLDVTPAVLIPRPETELLVETALRHLPAETSHPPIQVLDLGTGSGAIAIALAAARPDVAVTATDLSHEALQVARRNVERHVPDHPIRLLQGSWFAALAPSVSAMQEDASSPLRFAVIVSNPPYIAADDRHLQQGDLRFEPADALTDHAEGLQALRLIIAGAPAYLADDGWLFVEHGYDQATAVKMLFAAAGFAAIECHRDLAGIERVSGGRWPGKQTLLQADAS